MTGISEGASRLPAPRLRPYLGPYDGYRLSGFAPGTHVGMPSPFLTVIITVGSQIELSALTHPDQNGGRWDMLASGLTAAPCTIEHDGTQHGIQLALTPLGCRTLFGMPTAELGSWIVDLDDVLGADAREVRDRVSAVEDWDSRFDVLDEVFLRRVQDYAIEPTLDRAWRMLVGSGGTLRVGDVANDVGWSRRHLVTRFASEFGITPKDSARIARFHASHQMLRSPEVPSLAEVAAICGYYDQAHMAREWRELAGMSPSRWRARDEFAFVQDRDESAVADLTA